MNNDYFTKQNKKLINENTMVSINAPLLTARILKKPMHMIMRFKGIQILNISVQ